ncbi:MAG: DNA methyltransferase, partial [Ignavibacteriaceae bacterium]
DYLIGEINQILETRTIDRSRYYLKRLIKSLTEIKTTNINDLNLNRWKEYDDIITDSLWILDKRDKSGAHKGNYWGNFIPQIPNQFLRRYTKKGDWILDTFAGSGTTLIECRRLERNCIGIELNEDVVKLAKENIAKEKTKNTSIVKVVKGNSAEIDVKAELKKENINSVQFILMHPPYWDIIKFSRKKNDLSNAKSVDEFLKMFGAVLDNTIKFLEKGRYLAVVIGDKYSDSEWIPLGFYVMEEVKKCGLKLKSTIVKNFDTTKGKMNQKELWRYRALAGGFYIFKHEYIFLFQKPVK